MVEYLTKYSDYIINPKIPIKDMAVVKQFLEIFKWDNHSVHSETLENSSVLFKSCLSSEDFWTGLKEKHDILKIKYTEGAELDQELHKEAEQIQQQIEQKYS